MCSFIGKTHRLKLSTIFFMCFSTALFSGEKLQFVGDVDFPTGEKFNETEIGGLSGLAFDQERNKLLAVSDDKGFVNEPRYYEFDLSLDEKSFGLSPSAAIKFKAANGEFFKKGIADFEGISFWGRDLLVASEGSVYGKLFHPPELYQFDRQGGFIKSLPIPSKFIASGITDIMKGTRGNKAFEALSTALDNKTVYLATEESLFQDGPVSTQTFSSTVRIILYRNLQPYKEVAYRLEKVELDKSGEVEPSENGLVDIAAIDDKSFYSLERSYLPLKNKNVIRIFKNIIGAQTTDVAQIESLKEASFIPVKKELLLDLDEITPLLSSSTKTLDNIEALSFGPILKNGNRTLILCSDNNFGKTQRTMFLAFEVIKKLKKL